MSLCYITLKFSEGPCVKDHHPGVGGEDIVPNIRPEKKKTCSGSFHSQCSHWNGILNITLQIFSFIKLYELLELLNTLNDTATPACENSSTSLWDWVLYSFMFNLLNIKLLQNSPEWQRFPISLQNFLQIPSGDCFYISPGFSLLTYQPISSADFDKEPKCFYKHVNMQILEVEVQLGQCSPSGLTCKYLQACGVHLSVLVLLSRQSQFCLGSYVQWGMRLEFSPSSHWWRDNGRADSCLASTGNKKVQRMTKPKSTKIKKKQKRKPKNQKKFKNHLSESCTLLLTHTAALQLVAGCVSSALDLPCNPDSFVIYFGWFGSEKTWSCRASRAIERCWKRIDGNLQLSHKAEDLRRTYMLSNRKIKAKIKINKQKQNSSETKNKTKKNSWEMYCFSKHMKVHPSTVPIIFFIDEILHR